METAKTDTVQETVALFSAVTGIKLFPQPGETLPEFEQIRPHLPDVPFVCFLFSPEGFCRLALHHTSLCFVSSPIVCTPSFTNATYLRPSRLCHVFRLLGALFTPDAKSIFAQYAPALSRAVLNKSPAAAINLINHFPTEIVTKNGNDFSRNKQDIFCFVLMLAEFSENAGFLCPIPFNLSELVCANSLGELISHLNKARDSFMSACFPALWMKHAQIIETVCELIHSRYCDRITQSEAARAVFVSPSYLSKLFKEALGCSFNQYLNQVRIQKAMVLLELPLTEPETVFAAVGYENRSYYGKVFRKLTGTTPIQYRNRALGKE